MRRVWFGCRPTTRAYKMKIQKHIDKHILFVSAQSVSEVVVFRCRRSRELMFAK